MEESNTSFFKSPVFYSTIFAITVCTLAYYFILYKPKAGGLDAKSNQAEVLVSTSKETDSDSDGLPDWKELVYGSNQMIEDTDGDGVNDGKEVETGHDPTKPGPDDILHNISLPNSTTTAPGDAEQLFVAEFMSKEIENMQAETVNNLLKQVNTTQLKARYGLVDLNITSDNSDIALRNYANNFGTIIKKYTSSDIEDEASIMSKAISTKRSSDIQKMELPAITYRNFAEDLRKIETPSLLAEHHLNAVSGYDVMSRSLFLTTELFSNPIAGSAGWQTYLTQMLTVTRGYAGIINVLHTKNITFEQAEPGYHFRWRGETETTPLKKASTTPTNK